MSGIIDRTGPGRRAEASRSAGAIAVDAGRPWTVTADGGGSGCRLVAFDGAGLWRASAEAGPASLTLGVEAAWRNVCEGIDGLAAALGRSKGWRPDVLCAGLAGASQTERRQRFLDSWPAEIDVRVVTDGHAQLLGASGGQPGACLAVGTGSVLYWLDERGEIGSAGGWGFPSGDEGSGAWLGSRLIRDYLRYRDAGGTSAPVFDALEQRIGRDVSSVQHWSTQTRSTDLASLAPLIRDAAGDGDAVACALLDAGAGECARLFALAPGNLPLYLVGGLATLYESRLPASLRARLRAPRGTAHDGLKQLAAALDGARR